MRATALCLWLFCGATFACGHCVEDRIAVVYDHEQLRHARITGHQVAYFAIDDLSGEPSAQRRLLEQAAALPGVDPGSLRISTDPGALSLGFDPARQSAQSLEAKLKRRLIRHGGSLVFLRVGDGSDGVER